jgi:hypothetical protein
LALDAGSSERRQTVTPRAELMELLYFSGRIDTPN